MWRACSKPENSNLLAGAMGHIQPLECLRIAPGQLCEKLGIGHREPAHRLSADIEHSLGERRTDEVGEEEDAARLHHPAERCDAAVALIAGHVREDRLRIAEVKL